MRMKSLDAMKKYRETSGVAVEVKYPDREWTIRPRSSLSHFSRICAVVEKLARDHVRINGSAALFRRPCRHVSFDRMCRIGVSEYACGIVYLSAFLVTSPDLKGTKNPSCPIHL